MPRTGVWFNDTKHEKIEQLLQRNIEGYSEEFLSHEKRERFKTLFQSTTLSSLISELASIGLLVIDNSLKNEDKYKIDMSEYYELLLYSVLFIKSGFVSGEPDHDEVQARVNRLFRGSSDSQDLE
ncbi:hypothetical protein [Rosenbergiella collisarenosi]|uniref:hypothetical protein n=1 Tax=Rosenbergiella collisarenosi TaxID=1544695 RepID=UPI001F4DF735|nr:hypothetical protein [Rosenbergiella collisarenosi]